MKGLPEALERQFEYEDPIVRGGKQLLHSPFFKVILAWFSRWQSQRAVLCGASPVRPPEDRGRHRRSITRQCSRSGCNLSPSTSGVSALHQAPTEAGALPRPWGLCVGRIAWGAGMRTYSLGVWQEARMRSRPIRVTLCGTQCQQRGC